jgi:hypothetical protein
LDEGEERKQGEQLIKKSKTMGSSGGIENKIGSGSTQL